MVGWGGGGGGGGGIAQWSHSNFNFPLLHIAAYLPLLLCFSKNLALTASLSKAGLMNSTCTCTKVGIAKSGVLIYV